MCAHLFTVEKWFMTDVVNWINCSLDGVSGVWLWERNGIYSGSKHHGAMSSEAVAKTVAKKLWVKN